MSRIILDVGPITRIRAVERAVEDLLTSTIVGSGGVVVTGSPGAGFNLSVPFANPFEVIAYNNTKAVTAAGIKPLIDAVAQATITTAGLATGGGQVGGGVAINVPKANAFEFAAYDDTKAVTSAVVKGETDQKLNRTAKASGAEAIAGTDVEKWVGPYALKQALNAKIIEVAASENPDLDAIGELIDGRMASDFANAEFDPAGGVGAARGDLSNTVAQAAVFNFSILRNLIPGQVQTVRTVARATRGDGGGGTFVWDEDAEGADDGAMTLRPVAVNVSDPGRWLRQFDDNAVDPRWWGVDGTAETDSTAALNACFASIAGLGLNIRIPLSVKIAYSGAALAPVPAQVQIKGDFMPTYPGIGPDSPGHPGAGFDWYSLGSQLRSLDGVAMRFSNGSAPQNCFYIRDGLPLPVASDDYDGQMALLAAFDGKGINLLESSSQVFGNQFIGFDIAIEAMAGGDPRVNPDFGYTASGQHRISRNAFDCNSGVLIGWQFDVCGMQDNHFWPYLTASPRGLMPEEVVDVLSRPGAAWEYRGRCDWSWARDNFAYGPVRHFKIMGSNLRFFNNQCDGVNPNHVATYDVWEDDDPGAGALRSIGWTSNIQIRDAFWRSPNGMRAEIDGARAEAYVTISGFDAAGAGTQLDLVSGRFRIGDGAIITGLTGIKAGPGVDRVDFFGPVNCSSDVTVPFDIHAAVPVFAPANALQINSVPQGDIIYSQNLRSAGRMAIGSGAATSSLFSSAVNVTATGGDNPSIAFENRSNPTGFRLFDIAVDAAGVFVARRLNDAGDAVLGSFTLGAT